MFKNDNIPLIDLNNHEPKIFPHQNDTVVDTRNGKLHIIRNVDSKLNIIVYLLY